MVRGYVPLYRQNYLTYLVNSRAMWRRLRFWFKIYEAKHHIDIKVDMDEMDVTGAEKKLHTSRLKIMY